MGGISKQDLQLLHEYLLQETLDSPPPSFTDVAQEK